MRMKLIEESYKRSIERYAFLSNKLKLFGIGSLSMLLLVFAAPFIQSHKATDIKHNVIFILVDDYGYSDLGCYGSKFYETPNIDKLASEGVKFTNAYATCPACSPTRASIMTGKYPVNTGITDWIPGYQANHNGDSEYRWISEPFKQQLDLNEITIAEILKENNYSTMISGKWHLGELPDYWPEKQGFDINKGGYGAGLPNISKNSNGYFSPYGNPRLEDGPVGEYLTDRQTDEAIKFIKDQKNKPFFVFLSFYAVHRPLQGKEEIIRHFQAKADSMKLIDKKTFTEKAWIKRGPGPNGGYKERIIQSDVIYAAMIYSMDENLGRLFEKLKQLNIDKNTIIIFTSDNGGLSISKEPATTNFPLRAGKGWLYEGGIKVPLIVKSPFAGKPGSIISAPVSSIDYFATIAEMTGSELGGKKTDGISIVPLLKSGKMSPRPLFWHYPHYNPMGNFPGSAVRLGNFKLIDNFETGKQELYDLRNDISESNDISVTNTGKVKELYGLLKEWRNKTGAKMMKHNPNWNGKP